LSLKFCQLLQFLTSGVQIGAGEMKEFDSSLSHAHSWLKLTQIKENVDMRYYRQRNLVGSVYS